MLPSTLGRISGGVFFSQFSPIGRVSKKILLDNAAIIYNNPNIVGWTMASKETPDEHLLPKSNSQGKIFFWVQNLKKHPLVRSKTLPLVAWVFSEKNLLQRDYQRRLSSVSQVPGETAHSVTVNCPGEDKHSYCDRRDIDLVWCDIIPILEFLSRFFHNGLEYKNTLLHGCNDEDF